MVPRPIVVLDALPRTPGGKLDRNALPAPIEDAEVVPPGTDTERGLAGLWSELLDIAAIGRDSHFFDLGGTSLLAARLQARIEARFGIDLPLSHVFETPTLAGLAAAIDAAAAEGSAPVAAAPIPILRREPRRQAT
jgi:acyl carrier protein